MLNTDEREELISLLEGLWKRRVK